MSNSNKAPSYVLGVNAYHGDSSACLVRNGEIVAAAEEERFLRVKHWAGLPLKSIKYCLEAADIGLEEIDHIAISRNPMSQIHRKILFALRRRPNIGFVLGRLKNMRRAGGIKSQIAEGLNVDSSRIKAQFHPVEHHIAHSASSFFVSPFEEAAVVSIDAFGDLRSTMVSVGTGSRMDVVSTVEFPHSLGLLYTAVTQYLGFLNYGDEYKVMGLAALGQPSYLEEFRRMLKLTPEGHFELDLRYFRHATEGVSMTWDNCEPVIGLAFSEYMVERLGPSRKPEQEISERHKDMSASLQAVLEEAYFHVLRWAYDSTGKKALALAGGVAFNSVANGKISANTPFDDVYIQSAAGDAGTALGSASYVYHQVLGNPRSFVMENAYWGPEYDDTEIVAALRRYELTYSKMAEVELLERTASAVAAGGVVGWFQGRVEWGPRALGNRSIIADPRRADMKDILNEKIKRRESFRPSAPSILIEAVGDYFEETYPDPFMMKVYPIRQCKRQEIPAVTHVDGTGRLQTVRKQDNPRYWGLIKEFERQTGTPIVLNTSFNENEPITCSPKDAIECFLRTQMDVLVMGDYFVDRNSQPDSIRSRS